MNGAYKGTSGIGQYPPRLQRWSHKEHDTI